MRGVPTLPVGFTDQKLIKIFTDILRNLANVLDCNTYSVEVVWKVPFELRVPVSSNARTTSPDIVRLARAIASDTPTVPVHFGACAWTWLGNGSVRITDVDGLVEGVQYRLTFEAVG